MTNLDNQEYIILVKSINSRGQTIPPMLILCIIPILKKWAEENDLDKEILLTISPTRYFNDELAL